MKRFYFMVLAALFLFVPLVSSEATRAYPTLPESISSPSFGYVVHFDDSDPTSAGYMPAAQAQRMVDACNNDNTATAGNPNGLHIGYTDIGFLEPDFGSPTRNLYTYACTNCDSGGAYADSIVMPASMYDTASEQCIRSVVGHELFHHVQFAYITSNSSNWPNWIHSLEGTARLFQDKFYNDLDAWNSAGCCCGYVGEVNGYLANPNRDIWNLTYPSVLWWNYLSEQLGTLSAEPNAGADFIVKFFERAQANNSPADIVKALREAIAHYTSKSMESLFQDFTIANYTKQMDLSLLSSPSPYQYRDEQDGNGQIFTTVDITWSGSVPKTAPSEVTRWGARYFQADVSSCGDGVIGFHSEGDQVGYALIPIKGAERVQSINKAVASDYSIAFLQESTDPHTELGVVVTGGNDAANFTYTFDCGQVKMSIREPQHPDPIAYVGRRNTPERFLIKLRVQGPLSLGSPSVQGLDKDDFEVFVGDPSDPHDEADVINGAYVQGEYWLVVQAPEKEVSEPDTYNLTVKLGTIAIATNEGAVVYATKSVDQMLVIDKSGSMDYPLAYPKIDAAKEAGKLFVDSARSSDYTGVVSFSGDMSEPNDDATLEYKLEPVTDASRIEAKEAIEDIETYNMTSIGDGMYLASDVIVNHGRPAPPVERWIVLLSDGMENEAAYWVDVRDFVHDNNIKVNAIALGPLSDQPLMQSIAADTGGHYYYVDLPPITSGSSPSTSRAASDVVLDLADAYALSAEAIQTHERLWESKGSLSSGETIALNVNVHEDGIEDPLFTLSWSGGSMGDYNIIDPDGKPIGDLAGVEINRDKNHATFRLPKLASGLWTINLKADTNLAYRATLSGISRYGAQLRLFIGAYGQVYELPTNQFLLNQPIPIIASLTDMKGPILEAQVMVSVEHPDGSIMSLPLFDDGSHHDSLPDDGIYGGLYYRTTEGSKTSQNDTVYDKRGSYNVRLQAEGIDNVGNGFQRVARGSFSVIEPLEPTFEFQDTDKDGLINLYENLYPCMAYDIFDSDQDPDLDGLTNKDEFYFGTNPCNPDTDNGGENDLSEIKRGANPLDGSDDLLPPPIDVGVISQVSNDLGDPGLKPYANLIHYPASLAYQRILLYRRTNLSDPYILVDEFDAQTWNGLYYDDGLTAGTRYYYRLIGVNEADAMSAPSGEFSGIPRANPIPPVGGISINDHAVYTTSTKVRLYLPLDFPYNITREDLEENRAGIQMLISNKPDFSDSKWQEYNAESDWELSPDKAGNATVYVKFRDEERNESEAYHAAINVRSPGALGKIRLRIFLKDNLLLRDTRPTPSSTLITQAGVVVLPEGETGLPPSYTDADGYANLENLPPGRYHLIIQFRGYKPLVIEDVEVNGGQTTSLGDRILTHWQTYLPKITK